MKRDERHWRVDLANRKLRSQPATTQFLMSLFHWTDSIWNFSFSYSHLDQFCGNLQLSFVGFLNLHNHLYQIYALLNPEATKYCCYDDSFSFSPLLNPNWVLHLSDADLLVYSTIQQRLFQMHIALGNRHILNMYYWRPHMIIRKKPLSRAKFRHLFVEIVSECLLPSAMLKVDSENNNFGIASTTIYGERNWLFLNCVSSSASKIIQLNEERQNA